MECAQKISDLYLEYGPKKSRFPLNVADGGKYGRKGIYNYRVASLLKNSAILNWGYIGRRAHTK